MALLVLGKAAGFGLGLVLARVLGAERLGLYYLGVSFVMATSVLARLGLDQSALRFIALHAQRRDWSRARSTLRDSALLMTAASLAASIALAFASPWIAHRLVSAPDLVPVLRAMAAGIVFVAGLELVSNALKAVDRPVLATALKGAGVSTVSLLVIAPATLRFGVPGAAWVLVASHALLFFLGLGAFLRATRTGGPVVPAAEPRPFEPRPLLDVGLPLLLVASMNIVMQWTDTVMLGAFASTEAVGLYNVALRFAVMMTLINSAVAPIVVPRFSRLHAQAATSDLERVTRRATRIILVLTLPAFLMLVVFAGPLLRLFGPAFDGARVALVLLATGQLVNAATGPVGMLLAMTGNQQALRRNTQAGLVVNVGLNALLIPIWGLNGAAAATAFAIAFKNLRAVRISENLLGIDLRSWRR